MVDIFAVVIALFALIVSLRQNYTLRENLATEINKEFSEMWFVMDGIFIDHPRMHQFFYPIVEGKPCDRIPEKGSEEWDEAICIAEKFRDIFQYSEPLAIKLIKLGHKPEATSFYHYLYRITHCPIYIEMEKLNPININSNAETAVGVRLKSALKL